MPKSKSLNGKKKGFWNIVVGIISHVKGKGTKKAESRSRRGREKMKIYRQLMDKKAHLLYI